MDANKQIIYNIWASRFADEYYLECELHRLFPYKPLTGWKKSRYRLLRPFREACERITEACKILWRGVD